MPLSFASIVGGTCTLVGTSTNILVSSLATKHGAAPFSMFELTKLGSVFLAIGLIYLIFIGRRLLPDRAPTSLTRKYEMARYLTGLDVLPSSLVVGKSAAEARLNELYDVTIIEIIRGETRIHTGLRDTNPNPTVTMTVAAPRAVDGKREVGYVDGHANIMDEAAFRKQAKIQGWKIKVDIDIKKKDVDKALQAKIETLIKQLGAENFKVRKEARNELIKIGKKAWPFLKENVEHKDPEIRAAIKKIMDLL